MQKTQNQLAAKRMQHLIHDTISLVALALIAFTLGTVAIKLMAVSFSELPKEWKMFSYILGVSWVTKLILDEIGGSAVADAIMLGAIMFGAFQFIG